MGKLDQLIEEVSVELKESKTLLAAFEPHKRHQEGCKVLQMEVKRFQLELEGLQEKKRMAERFEKLRVTGFLDVICRRVPLRQREKRRGC